MIASGEFSRDRLASNPARGTHMLIRQRLPSWEASSSVTPELTMLSAVLLVGRSRMP